MFEDLYPATARAAKASMAEHGCRQASPPAAAVDGREPSTTTTAIVRPLRLTIDLPADDVCEVVIRVGRSDNALTVTLTPNGGAASPSRLGGAS